MASSGQAFPVSTQGSGVMLSNQGVTSSFGQPPFSQSQPSQMNSIQHQQSFTGPSSSTTTVQAQMMSPTKSRDLVAVCRLGQETNQELVNKMLEVFKQFKTMQLPNGANNNQYHERKIKIEESLRQLNIIFRRLRAIYDRVSEAIVDPNENPEEVLVPLKGDLLEDRN
ncbi:mediator of RNA polymerase II transcription subunit 30-like, partial [Ruditapes philippinarum]|uniref:mediator of RNA polymerase II transcription subunit 30-like n=1 Tax=Ruditapes philippinarum TaxID=129788 RepID=UPI00295BC5B5